MTPKELKHIAPILTNINKSGFTLPQRYFKEIENDVMETLSVNRFPESIGFSIPNNYFNHIEKNVSSKLTTDTPLIENDIPKDYFNNIEDTIFNRLAIEKKKTRFFSLKKYWIPTTIAASFLFLITIYNPFKENKELDLAEIEAWIEEGNLDLSTYEIASIYNQEIENLAIDPKLNTNDIENYLLEEDMDESILYN